MRNLSSTFRRELYANNRNYTYLANVRLADSTELLLTNNRLWSNGFSIDDTVSEDNSFTALGSAIIGSASIVIDNMDDSYSDYDFTNAKVTLSLSKTYKVDNVDTVESILMGTYTVDEATYNGSLITVSLLDNMEQFDRPYSLSSLTYPATLDTIVRNACTVCGVTLNTYDFPHKDYVVQIRPDEDTVTFREVLGWAATIAGCFARCNNRGQLELKWFDQETLESLNDDLDGGKFDSSKPYSTGDSADGGSFNPWNTGSVIDGGSFTDLKPIHYLHNLFSQTIGVDDIVITGIKIITEESDQSNKLVNVEHLFGQDGYVIEISNNPFITADTVNNVGTWLANQIVGLTFRNVNITHLNDPAIEAGDIGIVTDRKNNQYVTLITRTSFMAGGRQTTVCGAESASKNSSTKFSDATKSYVASRKLLNREQTAREQAIQALTQALDSKSGLYSTVETAESGSIYYLHDKPILADSSIVWKMTAEAWGVSTNGGETWNAGMTVNGDVIARILNAIGVNADWINTGALTIYATDETTGDQIEVFYADKDTGQVRLNGSIVVIGALSLNDSINEAGKTATNYIHFDNTGLKLCHDASNPDSGYNLFLTPSAVQIRSGSNTLMSLDGTTLNFYSNQVLRMSLNQNNLSFYKPDGTTIAANVGTDGLVVSSGKIGGFTIDANKLEYIYDFIQNNTYHTTQINRGVNSSAKAFYVFVTDKETDEVTDMFYVNYAGKLYAKNAEIEGKITAKNGTIGGINITTTNIHTGNKISYNNANSGFYLDADGNLGIGDGNTYIRFYDDNGTKKLAIKINELSIGATDIVNELSEARKTATNYIYYDANGLKLCTNAANPDAGFNLFLTTTEIRLRSSTRTLMSLDGSNLNFYSGENLRMALTSTNLSFYKPDGSTISAYVGTDGLIVNSGKIGGFVIDNNKLEYVYDYVMNNTYHTAQINRGVNSSAKAFYVFVTNKDTSEITDMFYVTYAGKLYAKNADIEGKITAKSGTVGGITISNSNIHTGNKTTYNSSNPGFYLGSDGNFGIGDGTSYIRFYDDDGTKKLAVKISELSIGATNIVDAINDAKKVATSYIYYDATGLKLCNNAANPDSGFNLFLTTTEIRLRSSAKTLMMLDGATLSFYRGDGEKLGMQLTKTALTFYGTDGTTQRMSLTDSAMNFNDNNGIKRMSLNNTNLIFYNNDGTTQAAVIGSEGLDVKRGIIGGWTITDVQIAGTVTKTTTETVDGEEVEHTATYKAYLNLGTQPTHDAFAVAVKETESSTWTYPFRVKYDGTATMTGTITATGGKIGGWTIDSSGRLYAGKYQSRIYMDPGDSDTPARMYLGIGSASTYLSGDGYLQSKKVISKELSVDNIASGGSNYYFTVDSSNILAYNKLTIGKSLFFAGGTLNVYSAGSILGLGSDGSTVCIHSSSSKRYKNHIQNMTSEYARQLLDVTPVIFKYKDGYLAENDEFKDKEIPGFYAEDVEEHYEAGVYHKDGLVENWQERTVIPAMLKLIQDKDSEIKLLSEKLELLENKLQKLENLVNSVL